MFSEFSTGASDDIARASNIAREMVTRYGMDEGLGHVAYETENTTFLGPQGSVRSRVYSDQTAQKIDAAIRELVNRSLDRAIGILRENLALLKESAEKLLLKETLTEDDLHPYFATIQPYQWTGQF
jgi:cell division protease FtsH